METAYGSIHKSVHGAGHDVVVRILTTCEQMLRDRGCADVQALRDARACFDVEDTSPAITGRGGTKGDDYDVYVHSEERVSVKAARAILERSDGVRAIVVSVEGPTPFTRRECDGQLIQFFTARELCVNVSRHSLVPKHEPLADGCGIDPKHLPKISSTDPIVQYYGWPMGTVVRVWRVFGGHEPIPYFRVVAPLSS